MTKSKFKGKKILVTSALPYANGSLHCGHLVEYIQVDIFVRFLRLIEEDVLFVCADDTHGAPIEIKSAELGISPEELISKVYDEHVKDFKDFLISFDNYYTTNSPENKHYSDLIFERLNKNGFIYTKDIEVTYCEHCKRTLPDRYVKGKCPKCKAPDQYGDVCENCNAAYKTIDLIDPYCAICKNKPIRKTSKHYFFKLSNFSKKLESWLKKNKNLQPEIKNFVFNWIKNGLEDWNISRDGPYFGFKIPGEENKYYYVWLDAPIGYIASTDNYCKKHGLKTEDYWNSKDSRIYHFIGKDIIYFHFLFWPAMLLGSGFQLPYNISVHGFLTVNGEKMSKSKGTFFTAREFLQKHNAEHLRFYYASLLSKTISDIDLNFDDFRKKINNELAANIGNFCYRVLNFLNKYFDGEIKDIDNNKKLTSEIKKLTRNIEKNYYGLNFNEAVKGILHISSLGNKYFQENEPWKLIEKDKEKVHKILGLCANIVKNLSILIEPILPDFSSKLQQQLNLTNLKWEDIKFELKKGTTDTVIRQQLVSNGWMDSDVDEAFNTIGIQTAQISQVPVPQNITSNTSLGPNKLIKNGAKLIMNSQDVIDGLDLQDIQVYVKNKQILGDSPQEEAILAVLSQEPKHIDEITKASNLASTQISATLTIMEMKGKVRNLGNMMYVTRS